MKRYGNIYESIYSMDNLRLAYNKAKKDKMHYSEVQEIERDVDYYLFQIQDMLKSKTYNVSQEDYTMFTKNDKGKIRKIYKLKFFPHRIVQWALMLQIQDILLNTFIDNTFASIPNRGIHLCLGRLDKDLKSDIAGTQYCLKMDIRKFYPSINHEINKQQYRRKFKDDDLLWLIDMMIDSLVLDSEGDLVYVSHVDEIEFLNMDKSDERGIAIGSLFSQWDGNYFMTPFDHWLKEEKKVKYYYRYCDDLVILHHDKEYLHQLRKNTENYLEMELDLQLKDNWQVFPVDVRGIDFVGYRHFRHYILLRKTTATQLKRRMVEILKKLKSGGELTYSEWCSVNSYRGWTMWCNGYNLTKKYIKPLEPYCKKYYLTKIKKGR